MRVADDVEPACGDHKGSHGPEEGGTCRDGVVHLLRESITERRGENAEDGIDLVVCQEAIARGGDHESRGGAIATRDKTNFPKHGREVAQVKEAVLAAGF